jgi:RNA polymerase sigma-70 factor, ECF subfamily
LRQDRSHDGSDRKPSSLMERAVEQDLIRRAVAGDGRAVESLIRANQAPLYAFMLRMSRRPDTAEDIVQEAFVRVLKNLNRFDDRFRFSTWLFTIAKRLYVNARQKHCPAFDSEIIGQREGGGPTPVSISEADEARRNIRTMLNAALAGLNEQQREIVILFHQLNWPIGEIARHLDMPEGTVKSHLHRGRKRMRELILADRQASSHVAEVWT